MDKEIEEKIEQIMSELNPDYYVEGYKWNGYNVFVPKYISKGNETLYIGYPYVVLEKDGEVRMSTTTESLKYFDYSEEKKSKSKSVQQLKQDIQEEI